MPKKTTISDIIFYEEQKAKTEKNRNKNKSFNKEIYDLGTEWSLNGKTLEEAHPEIKDDHSFIDGFKRGERLKQIENLNNSPKKR